MLYLFKYSHRHLRLLWNVSTKCRVRMVGRTILRPLVWTAGLIPIAMGDGDLTLLAKVVVCQSDNTPLLITCYFLFLLPSASSIATSRLAKSAICRFSAVFSSTICSWATTPGSSKPCALIP